MQVILLLKFLDALKQMKESEKANLTFFEHLEIKAEPTRALKILICHGLASGYTPDGEILQANCHFPSLV